MAKKLIRLTESDLHRIVKNTTNRVLREGPDESLGLFLPRDPGTAKDMDEYEAMEKFNQCLQVLGAEAAQRELDKFTHDQHVDAELSTENRIINRAVSESIKRTINKKKIK